MDHQDRTSEPSAFFSRMANLAGFDFFRSESVRT